MALTLQGINLQNTTNRFAKSTQHLISHFSKSFAAIKNQTDINDKGLSDNQLAIRAQINFERLLHKTLQCIQTTEGALPNPHYPPLLVRVEQYNQSLEIEFKTLSDFESNKNVKATSIKFNLFPQYQSQLNVIKNWIISQKQLKSATLTQDEELENEETQQEILENIKSKQEQQGKKDWKLRKRRRIMRFSEKLTKEYEEKRVRNEAMEDRQGKQRDGDEKKHVQKQKKHEELDERESLISELASMTELLKEGAQGIRKTLNKDKQVMEELDEETLRTGEKVESLNVRMKKYVESTSGMTCSLCLMVFTVLVTWIWCFFIIYFI